MVQRAPEALFVPPREFRPRSELAADPLRDRLAKVVEESALSLLEPRRIQAMAEDLGVVKLRRVHHLGLLATSLVLSALERQSDTSGRWLDAQQVYKELGGPHAGKTSFRNRTRQAVPLLQEMLNRRLKKLSDEADNVELRGRLAAFADVLIPDGCAFKLASVLCGYYPGTGNPAELKLHAVYSVKTGMATVTETAGRVHDNVGFAPTVWVKGGLYIWDLGYNDNERFIDAAKAQAIPLQRLKSDANPVALAWYDAEGRHPIAHPDGRPMRLNEATQVAVPAHGPLDLDVELRDATGRGLVARVVCIPYGKESGHEQEEDRYYLTVLPREVFTVFDVAELYRLRWEVELFFRNWHGALRMDDVHRLRHPDSVTAHVLSSLLAATLARDIHAGLSRIALEHTEAEAARLALSEADRLGVAAFPPGAPRACQRYRDTRAGFSTVQSG
jgi:hypothetical protein